MKKARETLKTVSLVLGLGSISFFIFNYFVFANLRPKMIVFKPISSREESLMNWVGIGLLISLSFYLLSVWQIIKKLKNLEKIKTSFVFLVLIGVLSFLFIFSDVALLNDIGKQYRHGLSQPEWRLLYPLVSFQLLTSLSFVYLDLSGFLSQKKPKPVVRDSNLFLIVQFVGLVCGLMGLTASSLGFLFSRAWNLFLHVVLSSFILLLPYFLVVSYWFLIKLREKDRQWYDEKQLQDVGKSAFLTLILSIVFMVFLFAANYHQLDGVVSILWLPLYLFLVLFLFSLGNLYFSAQE